MKSVIAIFMTVLVIAAGVIGFAYSGLYDVSARSPHGPIASWLLSAASRASIQRRAADVEVPDLDGEALILAGVNDYDSMCTGCHGAPGKDPDAAGQGLNPRPPDLAASAMALSPGEIFWITKHGIRMTGMPSWGVTHDDDEIWPVVAFVTRLPGMESDDYQDLLQEAVGHGHHADMGIGEPHEHVQEAAGTVHVHADGSEHVHQDGADELEPDSHEH